jgi:phage-related holin
MIETLIIAKLSFLLIPIVMDSSRKPHVPGLAEMFDLAYMKLTVLCSVAYTTTQAFLEDYVFTHSGWVEVIVFAVIGDTITGIIKSVKQKKFSSYKFGALMVKGVIYGLFVLILGGLYKVENDTMRLLATLGYSAIVVREVLSFVENVEIIRPNTFPKWLISRLEHFDEEGKVNE